MNNHVDNLNIHIQCHRYLCFIGPGCSNIFEASYNNKKKLFPFYGSIICNENENKN